MLRKTGRTVDGKDVVGGLYWVYQTHGVPFDIIFAYCIDNNSIPDWIDLYKNMLASGMKHERIITSLQIAIEDSFGPIWSKEVISNLNKVFSHELNTL